MGAAKFEIGYGPNNKFQWKLIGPDGKDVLVSQPFSNKDDAFLAIREVKANSPINERYKNVAEPERFFFRLMSASHVELACSAVFPKFEDCEAAKLVVRKSPEAAVMDQTAR